MNKYLTDFATAESNAATLTFEDGVEYAQEQFALESMFKDLDIFTGAIALAKPNMNDATAEALAIALGAPVDAVNALAAIEEDGVLKKVMNAIKDAIMTFINWIKKHGDRFLDMFRETSKKNIAYLESLEASGFDKDAEKNIKTMFKDTALEKNLEILAKGHNAAILLGEFDVRGSVLLVGFDDKGIKVTKDINEETGEFETIEKPSRTYSKGYKDVITSYDLAMKAAEDNAETIKRLQKADDAMFKDTSKEGVARTKKLLALTKVQQNQHKMLTQALSAVTAAAKVCEKVKPKDKDK